MSGRTFELDPNTIRDLGPEALDPSGRLRVLPAAFWAGTTVEERALLGHRYGLYSFPTVELVDHLRGVIAGRSAIEIGAGHGVLAEALDIPATDNRHQETEPHRSWYRARGQPIVPYGPNIIDCHASRAVRRYKPEVVIACWVTHKYDPRHHALGGNEVGVDELDVLRHCSAYVMVGNDMVHGNSALWKRPPSGIVFPEYVYSRASRGTDFIATWQGSVRSVAPPVSNRG